MKLLSLNIRYDEEGDGIHAFKFRRDDIIKFISKEKFDVMCFQELQKSQLESLQGSLTDYQYIYIRREEISGGEACAVFYKKNNFELIETDTFWLNETGEKFKIGWDAGCVRTCTYAKFKNIKNGNIFNVFNAHLDNVGQIARLSSVKLIKDKIEILGIEQTFLLGDFNVERSDEVYDRVVDGNLLDTKYIAKELVDVDKGTYHDYGSDDAIGSDIDYIFTNKKCDVDVFKVCTDVEISDHYPIYIVTGDLV